MRKLLLSLLLLAASTQVHADTLRCGSKIVQVGMSMTEVKEYCGKPSSTSIEVQDVRSGPRVVGQTEIHTWRYERASGQRTAVLEFDKEKLMSITYASK